MKKINNRYKVMLGIFISLVCAFSILFYTRSCSQEITSIYSLKEAQTVLGSADENTMIFFDVDDTLIVSENKSFWSKNIIQNQDFLYNLNSKTIYNPKNSKEKPTAYYRSIWKIREDPMLIENDSAQIIRELQTRGVKVLACTALPAREDFLINYLPEWRFEKLKVVDIDFSASNVADAELTHLQDSNGGYTYHPILYKGILCTGRLNKGVVIGQLLDTLGIKPTKIIFFDDSVKRVEEVKAEMCTRGIPFIGYEYKGEELLVGDFDLAVVEFQMHYLVDHEEWLSEEKARQKMMELEAGHEIFGQAAEIN